MIDNNSIEDSIATDKDFINARRYNNSLKEFLEKHPNGSSVRVIAQAMNMDPEDVQALIDETLAKLREKLGA